MVRFGRGDDAFGTCELNAGLEGRALRQLDRKSPGYDAAAVARVLEFASPSHLTSTAQRVCGTRSASLARLRTGDIIERFKEGRGRSRG